MGRPFATGYDFREPKNHRVQVFVHAVILHHSTSRSTHSAHQRTWRETCRIVCTQRPHISPPGGARNDTLTSPMVNSFGTPQKKPSVTSTRHYKQINNKTNNTSNFPRGPARERCFSMEFSWFFDKRVFCKAAVPGNIWTFKPWKISGKDTSRNNDNVYWVVMWCESTIIGSHYELLSSGSKGCNSQNKNQVTQLL